VTDRNVRAIPLLPSTTSKDRRIVKKIALIVVSLIALTVTSQAVADTPQFLPHGKNLSTKEKVAYFEKSLRKDQTAIAWLSKPTAPRTLERVTNLAWYKAALKWHTSLPSKYKAKLAPSIDYWVAKQIRVAELIGRSAGADPWPNCPDPIFNGASSWQETANCENGGNWYDSPGYYRCGLQFDPAWETKYGRLCP
jgi:hypothetical protein